MPATPQPLTAAPGAGPAARWTGALAQRARWHLLPKAVSITLFMWVFFALYFHTLRNPAYPVQAMPLTALDHAIAFAPGTVWAYVSLWLYVGTPVGLMLRWRDVLLYGVWIGALCLAGLTIFYFWPTAVPPPNLPPDAALHFGFAMLQGVDAAGNACPSLHVAGAVFSALWIQRLLRMVAAPGWLHAVNWVWLLLIVHSTLATKQHVVLDAAAGVLLALVFALPSLRWLKLR